MVPIKLRVVKEIRQLKPGQFVRLRRTMYRDDLCRVDHVDMQQNVAELVLVPRIDYMRMRGALRT